MKIRDAKREGMWQQLPPLIPPAPVFALTMGRGGIWAGGIGGVAWHPSGGIDGPDCAGDGWQPRMGSLPLSAVMALLASDDVLFAGGRGGIAYSRNGGVTWQQAALEDSGVTVSALVASPDFSRDRTAVAATMEQGILRTSDGGRTWINASFGLEVFEITALTWRSDSTILAASAAGIYRSSDGGRAWHRVYARDEAEIEAIAWISAETALAIFEGGTLIRSDDGGRHWFPVETRMPDYQVLSLGVSPVGTLLLGTREPGLLLRSIDEGTSWQQIQCAVIQHDIVHTLIYEAGVIYAGTSTGICMSADDGLSWQRLAHPPIHDLRTLHICNARLMVVGPYAGIYGWSEDSRWERMVHVPQPLTALACAPDGTLWWSSPDGLQCLSKDDDIPRTVIAGEAGHAVYITMRSVGKRWHGWAVSPDGSRLLRSIDSGATWQSCSTSFGIFPPVALQAISDRLLVATYDVLRHSMCLWFSVDDGDNWTRSVEGETNWPIVASGQRPAFFTMGNRMFLEHDMNRWRQVVVDADGGGIRRVLSIERNGYTCLFALTTTGIIHSDDMGETWQAEEQAHFSGQDIVDIAATDTALYVLLTGGYVWTRVLEEE